MGIFIEEDGGSTYRTVKDSVKVPPSQSHTYEFPTYPPPLHLNPHSVHGVAILPTFLIRSITMSAFSLAFTQCFNTIGMFFSMIHGFMSAGNSIATVAKLSAEVYENQARIDLQKSISAGNADLRKQIALDAPTTTP